MPSHHHVFLFRHCVRSTKEREKLHNNWTAFQNDDEVDYAPNDFVAESGPDWNTPEYWCTQTGRDIMEASGRFLYDQLVQLSSSSLSSSSTSSTLEVQIIADQSSQRDVDSALALLRGIRSQSLTGNNATKDPAGSSRKIQVKGLDQLHFVPALFHQWDDFVGLCDNKLKTSPDFQNLVRQEIQHRVDNISPPAPGLAQTLAWIESLAGPGSNGTLTQIPTGIDKTTTGNSSSFINTSSPFPILISKKTVALGGPVNIIKWFAEMAHYSRAGGVPKPFLKNANLMDVNQLVEWFDWFRTIVYVENSVAASKGSVLAKGILDALTHGSVPYSTDGLYCRSAGDDIDDSKTTTTTTPTTTTNKITILVGHDSDMDAVATSLGLRWRLDHRSHEASTSSASLSSETDPLDEYTPTPPGSAMHFVVNNEGTVSMDFWYPVFLEPHMGDTPRIPNGMQLNTSGILERTPMILKARSDNIKKQIKAKFSDDKKQTVLYESGMEVLYRQLQATLDQFPEAQECYDGFLQHTASTVEQDSCLQQQHSVRGIMNQSQGSSTIVGMAVGSLVTWLILVGWNFCRRRREHKRGATEVSTCEPVSNNDEVARDLVAA